LPIHPFREDRTDLYRAAALLHSLGRQGSMCAFSNFYIIVPDRALPVVQVLRELLGGNSPAIECIAESTIFSNAEKKSMEAVGGWTRQQLIKLAAPRFTSEKTLLTLDSDVLNIRRLDVKELAPGGFIPIQFGPQHGPWVHDSAKLAGIAKPSVTMGVTPAFLSLEVLAVLHAGLSTPTESWVETLCGASAAKVQWTEYMLYQCFAIKAGLWEQLHKAASGCIYDGIWRNTAINSQIFSRFSEKKAVFLVCQSVRTDSERVHECLRQHGYPSLLDLPSHVSREIAHALDSAFQTPSAQKNKALLRKRLDSALADVPTETETWTALRAAVGQSVASSDKLNNLVAAWDEGRYAEARNLLAPLCADDDVPTRLLRLYYETLLRSQNFQILYSDVLRRLEGGTRGYPHYLFALGALSAEKLHSYVAKLILAGRRRYGRRASFHRACADAYLKLGKLSPAKAAARRASALDPTNLKYANLSMELQSRTNSV